MSRTYEYIPIAPPPSSDEGYEGYVDEFGREVEPERIEDLHRFHQDPDTYYREYKRQQENSPSAGLRPPGFTPVQQDPDPKRRLLSSPAEFPMWLNSTDDGERMEKAHLAFQEHHTDWAYRQREEMSRWARSSGLSNQNVAIMEDNLLSDIPAFQDTFDHQATVENLTLNGAYDETRERARILATALSAQHMQNQMKDLGVRTQELVRHHPSRANVVMNAYHENLRKFRESHLTRMRNINNNPEGALEKYGAADRYGDPKDQLPQLLKSDLDKFFGNKERYNRKKQSEFAQRQADWTSKPWSEDRNQRFADKFWIGEYTRQKAIKEAANKQPRPNNSQTQQASAETDRWNQENFSNTSVSGSDLSSSRDQRTQPIKPKQLKRPQEPTKPQQPNQGKRRQGREGGRGPQRGQQGGGRKPTRQRSVSSSPKTKSGLRQSVSENQSTKTLVDKIQAKQAQMRLQAQQIAVQARQAAEMIQKRAQKLAQNTRDKIADIRQGSQDRPVRTDIQQQTDARQNRPKPESAKRPERSKLASNEQANEVTNRPINSQSGSKQAQQKRSESSPSRTRKGDALPNAAAKNPGQPQPRNTKANTQKQAGKSTNRAQATNKPQPANGVSLPDSGKTTSPQRRNETVRDVQPQPDRRRPKTSSVQGPQKQPQQDSLSKAARKSSDQPHHSQSKAIGRKNSKPRPVSGFSLPGSGRTGNKTTQGKSPAPMQPSTKDRKGGIKPPGGAIMAPGRGGKTPSGGRGGRTP